ncbi:MAG: UDP-N-acetylmuramate dehydrogenase [Candidatus Saccharimonadales bacterium]
MNVQHNVELAPYTSLRVGGMAKNFIQTSGQDLQSVVMEAGSPIWVIGYGTNSLISDKGLDGTVVMNQGGHIKQLNATTIKVDSGVLWDDFIQKLIELGLYGLEFTSGVPGSTGAAVIGNIAAYGHAVADSLVGATILNTETGTVTSWENEAFEFGYRTSALQKPQNSKLVVLDATFQLSPTAVGPLEYDSALKIASELHLEANSLANRRTIILETRRRAGSLVSTNSKGPWTAGSFFKNPVVTPDQVETIISYDESGITKQQLLRQNQIHGGSSVRVSAAHVLLAAGFNRGQTWGQVRLHPDHILKIENVGQATAQEIYEVVQEIISTVSQKLGITLEPEVRFLGDFS